MQKKEKKWNYLIFLLNFTLQTTQTIYIYKNIFTLFGIFANYSVHGTKKQKKGKKAKKN